jgi:glycosyltransferase involved in cell wall biosynthesis
LAKPTSPLVSVIIPAYNVASYISEALESVFAQDFTDYEVIVVNDGSPDTIEFERLIQPYFQRIIYLKQENRGVSAARNAALRIARGQYVAFLDADDVWLPNKLSHQLAFLRGGNYDLVYANALYFGESLWAAGTTFMDKLPSEGDVTRESILSQRCTVLCSTVVATRAAVLDAGAFDEKLRMTEDFDLWLRMLGKKARIAYQKEVLASYRIRSTSSSSDRLNLEQSALLLLEKVGKSDDLTEGEREALNRTRLRIQSEFALERGKVMILEGNFQAALQLLKTVKPINNRWKLLLVKIGLRFYPSLTRRIYRGRMIAKPTADAL